MKVRKKCYKGNCIQNSGQSTGEDSENLSQRF